MKYIIAGIARIKHTFIFFVNVCHKHVIKNRKVHHAKGECFHNSERKDFNLSLKDMYVTFQFLHKRVRKKAREYLQKERKLFFQV